MCSHNLQTSLFLRQTVLLPVLPLSLQAHLTSFWVLALFLWWALAVQGFRRIILQWYWHYVILRIDWFIPTIKSFWLITKAEGDNFLTESPLRKCFFQWNSPYGEWNSNAMKYAVAYEIFASQMLRANFISLSALAENFIIRQDYFISHSDISL